MRNTFYIAIAFLTLTILGCDQTINERKAVSDRFDKIGIDSTRSYSLGESTPAIYMDAHALKAKFLPLFGDNYPRGEAWAQTESKRNVPIQFWGEYNPITPQTYFSVEEYKAFGTYKIRANLLSPLSQSRMNVSRMKIFSQGYMKALRAFLSDACARRIELDRDAIIAKKADTVIMHKFSAPSVDDIAELMAEMFGVVEDPRSIKGAADYKAVYDLEEKKLRDLLIKSDMTAAIRAQTEQAIAMQLYRPLCIAVGQDPRTFLR